MSGLFSLTLAILLLCPGAAFAAPGHEEPAHALGPFSVKAEDAPREAAGFALKDMDGQTRTLEEFRGRVLLIHFWASWCGPCKAEFPALSALASEFGARGLAVVGVAVDSRARVEAFLGPAGAGFPVLIDQYGALMRKYRVGVIPVSVIVGRDGQVIGTLTGPIEYAGPEARGYFGKILK